MRGLSLFSGIGGLDLAAEAVGLDVSLSTDISEDAVSVLSSTTGVRTISGDIARLLSDEKVRADLKRTKADIVFGGPPCTAFSHAGFWLDYKREGDDPAAAGLSRFADVVELVAPRAFVMENVPGLLFSTHRAKFEDITKRYQELGYRLSHKILSATAFGVAQARRRLFLVGIRGRKAVDLESWASFPNRSASWALEALPATSEVEHDEVPRGKYGSLLATVPPGGNYIVHTTEGGSGVPHFRYRGRYWSFLLKLDPSMPASTIPAQRVTWNGPFHWDSRHLRIREMARLQFLPDSMQFSPKLELARRQVGNAVPVVLGAAVIHRVLDTLSGTPEPALLREARTLRSSWSEVASHIEVAILRARLRAGLQPALATSSRRTSR